MNIVEKITIKENKTLKLGNILIRDLKETEVTNMDKVTYMMENYIKSKGNTAIGPLITYSSSSIDECGKVSINSKIMIQLKNSTKKVDYPYKIKDEIKVSNCVFARYTERQESLQYAYSKIQLYAFENDINLKGDSYTIFVNSKSDKLIADVFMEVQKEDLAIESL